VWLDRADWMLCAQMRENEELSTNLLSMTNDRDRYMSQLQDAGIETTNAAGEKQAATGDGSLLEEKVRLAPLSVQVISLI
jgi:hypothetical protein